MLGHLDAGDLLEHVRRGRQRRRKGPDEVRRSRPVAAAALAAVPDDDLVELDIGDGLCFF